MTESPSNNPSAPPWPAEDWKREFVEIFFARHTIILSVALLVFAASLGIAFFWPPTYQSTAYVLVRGKKPQVSPELLEKAEIRTPTISEEDLASEMQILRSPDLIRLALLTLYPDSEANPAAATGFQPLDEGGLAKAVNHVRTHLHHEVVPSSNVIRIHYLDKDPRRAEAILDALLDEYVSYRTGVFSPPEEAAFLEGRTAHYLDALHEHEHQTLELARRGNVALIRKEMDNNSDLMRDLRRQLAQARVELERQRHAVGPLERAVADEAHQLFAFLNNDSVNRVGAQLAILLERREDTARHYLADSPKMLALNEQVDSVYAILRREAQTILNDRLTALESLTRSIEQLERSIQELANRNVELQALQLERQRVDRTMAMLEHSYQTYARRSEEARVSAAIAASRTSGDVGVLARAAMTATRAFPDPKKTILAGLAAGIVLGLSLGFLAEYLDHTLNRPGEAHRYVGLPVICSLKRVP